MKEEEKICAISMYKNLAKTVYSRKALANNSLSRERGLPECLVCQWGEGGGVSSQNVQGG